MNKGGDYGHQNPLINLYSWFSFYEAPLYNWLLLMCVWWPRLWMMVVLIRIVRLKRSHIHFRYTGSIRTVLIQAVLYGCCSIVSFCAFSFDNCWSRHLHWTNYPEQGVGSNQQAIVGKMSSFFFMTGWKRPGDVPFVQPGKEILY